MPDESFVGRSLPAAGPFQVGREKIREFAVAIGDASPLSRDLDVARAAGHPDLVAPPTFSTTFTMPLIEAFLRDPDFGWDYTRMVHGDQRITFHRPIHGGDELFTTIHVDELRTRAGSHMLTLRCEVADAAGAPVATTSSLLVTQA
ncbi:MaoC family dehydratase N-terminal domain-containing protein [Pseudonocardia sp. RS11V-5]|uniref:FAS1-like dehydratase domain-containing protein n=1 Tax=Pseudonocardia terrae TaxID=2905831 RepID=UPI001E2C10E9|nr:MaoC family dehydratase N-terminal domain-containing protein [Pseudonocardia terrae]MCE3552537.1 MaoC family dehydratase N-terminal domain-containing protein [Pseudonocardia terrae]